MTIAKEFALTITGIIAGMVLLLALIYAISKSNLLAPPADTDALQAPQDMEQSRLD